MVRVPVPGRRSTVTEDTNGWQATMPAPRQPFAMLFLPLWLVGWGVGEFTVIRQLLHGVGHGPDVFLAAWLAMWTLGGAFAIFIVLWMFAGRQRVVLRPDALVVRYGIAGLSRSWEYAIGNVTNLRVAPETMSPWIGSARSPATFWGFGGGPIAFDYGARTVRLGAGLDEAEAQELVQQMQSRHRFAGAPATTD